MWSALGVLIKTRTKAVVVKTNPLIQTLTWLTVRSDLRRGLNWVNVLAPGLCGCNGAGYEPVCA